MGRAVRPKCRLLRPQCALSRKPARPPTHGALKAEVIQHADAKRSDENGTLVFTRDGCHPVKEGTGTFGLRERRFYAFNLLEELDAPGEWWIDRTAKRLYLYPPTGKPCETDNVMLLISPAPLLKAVGVHHLRFEDLAFEGGYGDGIDVMGKDIRFEGCRVAGFGGLGMRVRGDRNVLRDVEVCDVGRGGIVVSGGDRRTLRKSETRVEDCHVHDWAVFQRTAADGLRVDGCGVTVRRNRLHDAPHTAIGYGGNEHLFESNDVSRVLLETADAGAYYTGRDWASQGNVLRFNYTHDLGPGGEHVCTMGFYFDDCDGGDAVYSNVFHKVARGIMIGGGRDHPVVGNVFSQCEIGLSIDPGPTSVVRWPSGKTVEETVAAAGGVFDFVKQLPMTYDDTIVPIGEIAKKVVVARRHGTTWFVAGLCGEKADKVEVRLDFLDAGVDYSLDLWRDDVVRKTRIARRGDVLTLGMFTGGGFAAVLTHLRRRRPSGVRGLAKGRDSQLL